MQKMRIPCYGMLNDWLVLCQKVGIGIEHLGYRHLLVVNELLLETLFIVNVSCLNAPNALTRSALSGDVVCTTELCRKYNYERKKERAAGTSEDRPVSLPSA